MLCLNALWQIGEGNVEEVRRVVSQGKPLAYTTVLTLLDRLARRGAVSRRKEGRGFRYQPTVERNRLRRMALKQFLEYHFEGAVGDLQAFLEAGHGEATAEELTPEPVLVGDLPPADGAAPLSMAQFAGDSGRPPDFPHPVGVESVPPSAPDSEM